VLAVISIFSTVLVPAMTFRAAAAACSGLEVSSVSPNTGPDAGGTSVTLTGCGFTGATAVDFGTAPAGSFHVSSDTSMTAVSPATAGANQGTVDITVTAAGGTSATSCADQFNYATPAPAVTSVSPGHGSEAGGTAVAITGTGFSCANTTEVLFGAVQTYVFTVESTNLITAVSPPSSPGTKDVQVGVIGGGNTGVYSPATTADHFSYWRASFFAWYDRVSSPGFLNDNIHVVNPSSTQSATVDLSIPGSPACTFMGAAIPVGGERIFSCASGFGGPVVLLSDSEVLASQRVQFYQSFNEVPASPFGAASTQLWFAWFDRRSDPGFWNDNVHVLNPEDTTTSVSVDIPGCAAQTADLASGAEQVFTCPGGFGGPVTVDASQPVIASQRVQYYETFNEELGQQSIPNGSNYLQFSWFDRISDPGFQSDNIHVWLPFSSGETNVTATIPGCAPQTSLLTAGTELIFTCATGFGGPVTIRSGNSGGVMASQRVKYYSSFNEVPASNAYYGASPLYLSWFDRVSDPGFKNDNVHIWNPTGTTAEASMTIAGVCTQDATLGPGQEVELTCPGGIGGPVEIASNGSVLASQRVQYYQSFNETLAQQLYLYPP
jgi:IPT/TIG domain-containing protein